MYSGQNKIHKDKGVAPTEFEEQVTQVIVVAVYECFFLFYWLLID
jgi:hypothetical protein